MATFRYNRMEYGMGMVNIQKIIIFASGLRIDRMSKQSGTALVVE